MITGYGVVPLRIATWLGFFCAALGLALLVYVVVRFAVGETTVQGFTTLAALVSMFAGAQMLTIGIIGEYLGRQHFRSMNRPMYLVRPHVHDEGTTSE
jgi:undecaprenyl-phosphate 4-deoxy-4-formamido-L-arabinose transferase